MLLLELKISLVDEFRWNQFVQNTSNYKCVITSWRFSLILESHFAGWSWSGKQSLTRRAAYISSPEIGQIASIPSTRAKTLSSIHK